MSKALIVVDIQNDFCEGGALAVTGGNLVAESVAKYLEMYRSNYEDVVFTADWHQAPPSTNGGHFGDPPDFIDSWPVHCVQGTKGAEFHDAIKPHVTLSDVFLKGDGQPDYSGFQARAYNGETLRQRLDRHGIERVNVVGLATDYCVKETAIHAVKFGFETRILPALTASVHPDGLTKALDALVTAMNEVR